MAEQLCMSKQNTVRVQFGLGFIMPIVLQSFGLFTPFWVLEDDSMKGLFYSCSKTTGHCMTTEVLNEETLTNEICSLTGIVVVMLFWCLARMTVRHTRGSPWKRRIHNVSSPLIIFLYPSLGILNVTSCASFARGFDTLMLGPSFYVILATGLLVILMVSVVLIDYVCKDPGRSSVCQSSLIDIL